MSEGASSCRICLVCGDQTTGCHFGIDACRACGAFFRRTIIERKIYVCRTGGRCAIDKGTKPMCRKCRLKKCVDLGMQPSGVQVKSDEVDLIADDPFPISVGEIGSGKMFQKILDNYRELRIIRKATERALDPEAYKNVETSGLFTGYTCIAQDKWLTYCRAHTPSIIEFVANSIEGYHELQEEERMLLLKPFIVYFWWLDAGFRTSRLVPRDLYTICCLMTETTFIDVRRSGTFFDETKIPPFLQSDVDKLMKKEMSGDRMRSMYMMDDLAIKDEEFAALIPYLFWNNTVGGCSEAVHQLIRRQRTKVSEELGKFYQRTNESNPFVRLGEVLNIQNLVMIEAMRCREDMEVYKIWDAFEHFDAFYEIIKAAQ